jgi:hypothetical protein
MNFGSDSQGLGKCIKRLLALFPMSDGTRICASESTPCRFKEYEFRFTDLFFQISRPKVSTGYEH